MKALSRSLSIDMSSTLSYTSVFFGCVSFLLQESKLIWLKIVIVIVEYIFFLILLRNPPQTIVIVVCF